MIIESCDVRGDLTGENAQNRIDNYMNETKPFFSCLIGHGNKNGTELQWIKGEDIILHSNIDTLWLYSCNSAKGLCGFFSEKVDHVIGFLKTIIAVKGVKPEEITEINSKIHDWERMDLEAFEELSKKTYLEMAMKELERKNIFDASILNHKRLNIRFFKQ